MKGEHATDQTGNRTWDPRISSQVLYQVPTELSGHQLRLNTTDCYNVNIYFVSFQFIFRVWKIVPPTRADSHTPPYEYKDTYQEFTEDTQCQSKFGHHI